MKTFMEKLRIVFTDKSLRTRIFLTLGILALSRLLASIPIPGIDVSELQNFLSNQFIGLLNIFSGGGLSNLSVVMLGVGPYITASIIMQLLTMMSPKLKAMYQEEGQAGRLKFTQISRILTVPLALVQAFSFLAILQRQGVISPLVGFDLVSNLIVITGGSLLLMWLGELVTEFGIGNGVSLLIFSGIVAGLPQIIGREAFVFSAAEIPLYFGFLVVAMLIVVGGGVSTYLPLRINQAGVIPIIFALSILLLPQMALSFLSGVGNEVFQKISSALLALLSNGWVYAGLYFILVFLFTYFYTAVTFDPNTISSNLQKNGAFIPGVRPGQPTSEYIAKVLTRITLVGALFLGIIAVLPLAMRALTNTPSLAIGGTALLIVVSVVLDLMKKVDAQISMREY